MYNLNKIGVVKNNITDRMDANWGEVISRIVVEPHLDGGLYGLNDFSHVIIISYLHQSQFNKENHLKRRPRNLSSMPKVGIFSQRAKNRPNAIGVTAVEILEVSDNELIVKGLDVINNTPILDIKPYYPEYDKKEETIVPEWVNRLMGGYF